MFPCGLFYSTRQQRSVNSLITGKKAIHVPVLDLIQHLTIRQYTCCVCKSKLWRHCQTEGYIINHHFPFKMEFPFLHGIFTRFCPKIMESTVKLQWLSRKFTFIQLFSQLCMCYHNVTSKIVIDLCNFYQNYK